MNHSFVFISLTLALMATLGALLFGLFTLLKGGEFPRLYGNKAMQWRVLLQMIALILFTCLLVLRS